jgi:hypothetical protein
MAKRLSITKDYWAAQSVTPRPAPKKAQFAFDHRWPHDVWEAANFGPFDSLSFSPLGKLPFFQPNNLPEGRKIETHCSLFFFLSPMAVMYITHLLSMTPSTVLKSYVH